MVAAAAPCAGTASTSIQIRNARINNPILPILPLSDFRRRLACAPGTDRAKRRSRYSGIGQPHRDGTYLCCHEGLRERWLVCASRANTAALAPAKPSGLSVHKPANRCSTSGLTCSAKRASSTICSRVNRTASSSATVASGVATRPRKLANAPEATATRPKGAQRAGQAGQHSGTQRLIGAGVQACHQARRRVLCHGATRSRLMQSGLGVRSPPVASIVIEPVGHAAVSLSAAETRLRGGRTVPKQTRRSAIR